MKVMKDGGEEREKEGFDRGNCNCQGLIVPKAKKISLGGQKAKFQKKYIF
jgi:hypothetical protein